MFTLRFERVNQESGHIQSVILSAPTYVIDDFTKDGEYVVGVYETYALANGTEYRVSTQHEGGFTYLTVSNENHKVVEQLHARTPPDAEEKEEEVGPDDIFPAGE